MQPNTYSLEMLGENKRLKRETDRGNVRVKRIKSQNSKNRNGKIQDENV